MTAARPEAINRQEEAFRPFEVEVERGSDMVRVSPCGELDMDTAALVRERVGDLTAGGLGRLLLDLRQLTFMDSSGLRLVLELQRAAAADGWELAVAPGPAQVQRVFDVTGMRSLVPFSDGSGGQPPAWARAS